MPSVAAGSLRPHRASVVPGRRQVIARLAIIGASPHRANERAAAQRRMCGRAILLAVSRLATIAGIPLTQLTPGTGPLFVIDGDDFRSRAGNRRGLWSGANVHYAAKAFRNKQVARWISEEGLSGRLHRWESAVALHASFPPERIALRQQQIISG